ncbi:MAG: BlaI/MecI/CopY family transcriptional regulator [Limisphaerales bacterium]
MAEGSEIELSRRERQIMDVIYHKGRATAMEVVEALPDPPSYSAVRALLAVLERKGHLSHIKEGAKYLYLPTEPRERAAESALKRILRTFFDNSAEKVVAALLDNSEKKISDEELQRLQTLIDKTRKEKR